MSLGACVCVLVVLFGVRYVRICKLCVIGSPAEASSAFFLTQGRVQFGSSLVFSEICVYRVCV